ncbi:MAG TPA: hypothetical protein PL096_13095 [Micropepsaceae bacterium]|nr:hypothetical protein [Micropepsaceae bacterium]
MMPDPHDNELPEEPGVTLTDMPELAQEIARPPDLLEEKIVAVAPVLEVAEPVAAPEILPALYLKDFSVEDADGNVIAGPISLTLHKGEVRWLDATAEAGRALACVISGTNGFPYQGTIAVDGEHPKARAQMTGIIFDDPRRVLPQGEAAGFMIDHIAVTRAAPQGASRILDALKELGFRDIAAARKKLPCEIAMRDQHRLAAALGLAGGPSLVIAVDPGAELEALDRLRFLEGLSRLRQRLGFALLIITPRAGVAETLGAPDTVRPEDEARMRHNGRAPHQSLSSVIRFEQVTIANLAEPRKAVLRNLTFDAVTRRPLCIYSSSAEARRAIVDAILRRRDIAKGKILVESMNTEGLSGETLRRMRWRLGAVWPYRLGTLDPMRSVGDAIREPLKTHGLAASEERHSRMQETIDAIGLDARDLARRPYELSPLDRQRVALARALVMAPPGLLLCDATDGMTPADRDAFLDLARATAMKQQLAMLMVTHDAGDARFADDIIVIHGGDVVDAGPPSRVFGNPVDPFTAAVGRLERPLGPIPAAVLQNGGIVPILAEVPGLDTPLPPADFPQTI